MPALIIVILILMVASFGFWDTLEAILGGIGIFILLILLLAALLAAAVALVLGRRRRRP